MRRKWIICPSCEGEGTQCTITHDGCTASEWDELTDGGQDYEFIEAYNEGCYDKTCEFCKGKGKITQDMLEEWKDYCEDPEAQALRKGYIF